MADFQAVPPSTTAPADENYQATVVHIPTGVVEQVPPPAVAAAIVTYGHVPAVAPVTSSPVSFPQTGRSVSLFAMACNIDVAAPVASIVQELPSVSCYIQQGVEDPGNFLTLFEWQPNKAIVSSQLKPIQVAEFTWKEQENGVGEYTVHPPKEMPFEEPGVKEWRNEMLKFENPFRMEEEEGPLNVMALPKEYDTMKREPPQTSYQVELIKDDVRKSLRMKKISGKKQRRLILIEDVQTSELPLRLSETTPTKSPTADGFRKSILSDLAALLENNTVFRFDQEHFFYGDACRTETPKPWVPPVVREAESRLAADDSLNHEYLPVPGFEPFTKAATELLLGPDCTAVKEGRTVGVQCLSGTGSLRAGAEFLTKILKMDTVYVSNPTWDNHKMVFKSAGFTSIYDYKYYDSKANRVTIEQMVADLEAAPERSAVVLHGYAHNPTGMDPTRVEWKQIAAVIKRRNLLTFFDITYQGFASGDPNADAWAIRYFVDQGLELVVAQSFAKNFGLYNDESLGNLTMVVSDAKVLEGVKTQMSLIIRANWSNPPSHGARIVHMVLTDPALRKQWHECIQAMSSTIKLMRAALQQHLETLRTPGSWEHITKQIGLFSYTGLTAEQVDHLVMKHKVFLLKDGRMNIYGLNPKNMEYVAKAFDDAVRNVKISL